MSARPRILVTAWRRTVPTFLGERTVLDALDPAYAERVADAGGVPLIAARTRAAAAEALDGIDGLLLSGGGDVDPATYGAPREDAHDDDPGSDAWELDLLREATARDLSVLGICRGAQIMAVGHGGALSQQLPAAAAHRDMAGLTAEQILAERHSVVLAASSRVREVFGAGEVSVNTIHHHGIADPGTLSVTGTAPGGLIEAVEGPGRFVLGVQWHPEKMNEPAQRRLFDALVRSTQTP